MRIVIALGGNALLQRGQPLEAKLQAQNIIKAAKAIAQLAEHHQVVICHGNGPQVGLLALQSESYAAVEPYPLDVLDAETQGMIGYLLQRELCNALPDRRTVTLLNQVQVDPKDPAFATPDKFIGPTYEQLQAESLATQRGWQIKSDGQYYRRVVPSPEPQALLEIETITQLVDSNVVVICGGGGGIPVAQQKGRWCGIEAVVDKDKTAALLAQQLRADRLVILTDVAGIYERWGQKEAQHIDRISTSALEAMHLPSGSMGPKAVAACRYVNATQNEAIIGRLEDAAQLLSGKLGTHIYKE